MDENIGLAHVLAFLLEMAAMTFLALWAWRLDLAWWLRLLVMVALLLAFILPWTYFLSPKAPHRLVMPWILLAKLFMLGLPGLVFFWGKPVPSLVWAGLVAFYLLLGAVKNEL